jgi:peptidoglycan/LPS O-acetylase OafA/YrhL
MPSDKYLPWMDGLRAVAILAVMGTHTIHIFGWPVLVGGNLGVDIFFVLSGFLITSTLLREWDVHGNISFKNFYARRFLRLFPAHFLLLAVLSIFSDFLFSSGEASATRNAIPLSFFYVSDFAIAFFDNYSLGALKHTWSLAVEEQFYLVWPPLLGFMLSRFWGRKSILVVLVAIVIAIAVYRAILWDGYQSIPRIYYSFDARCDSLLLGCVASLAVRRSLAPPFLKRSSLDSPLLLPASLGFFIVASFFLSSYDSLFMYLGGFTVISASVAMLIYLQRTRLTGGLEVVLSQPILVWVGKISYGLYLWHYPVYKAVSMISIAWYWQLIVAVGLTFIISFLSYNLIEKNFIKLNQRFRRIDFAE